MRWLLLIPAALIAVVGLRAWDWYQMPDCLSGPWSKPACFESDCIYMRTEAPPRPPFMQYITGRPYRVTKGYRVCRPDEDTLARWKERESNGGPE